MRSEPATVRIFETSEDLAQAAAEECTHLALEAVETRGRFSIALAGGSTPKRLYSLLASESENSFRARFPWTKTDFFWGDERHVPPDHTDSNYRMAFETMLSNVPVVPSQLHRIEGENPDAGKAALGYEEDLLRCFRLDRGAWPQFDLALLGLGPDGHTASLFPDTDVLEEIAAYGTAMQQGISRILNARGIAHSFAGHPSMGGLFFKEKAPTNYRDWKTSDYTFYDQLAEKLIARGVMCEPDSREPWFISSAHDAACLAETLDVFEEAVDITLEELGREHGAKTAPLMAGISN